MASAGLRGGSKFVVSSQPHTASEGIEGRAHLSREKLSSVLMSRHPAAFSVALVGMNSRSEAHGSISRTGPGIIAAAATTASRRLARTASSAWEANCGDG